jgi:EpsI family protein
MALSEPMAAFKESDGLWLATIFAILLALYYSTVLSFYNIYSDEGYGQSHAPLLLAVSIYLLYRAWDRGGRRFRIRLNLVAAAAVAVLSLLWMVLGLVFIEAGQQAVLILIVAVTLIALLGWGQGAKFIMPFLLLWTVLPLYSPVVPYLQTLAAQSSALVLDLIGLTSTRDGYLLIIPNGTFEVADACSGLKFQMVGVTLALIHTQLIQVSARATIAYVALASLLAFVSNVIRIVVVVIIGYFFGMESEYVQDHNFIGWILFAIFFFLYLFFGEKQLRRYESNKEGGADTRAETGRIRPKAASLLAVLLALAAGPMALIYFTSQGAVSDKNLLNVLHEQTDWQQTASSLAEWAPIWTRGTESFEGSFERNGERVDLFATMFKQQRQGHEAVNLSHRVYDIEKWSRISRSARVIELPQMGKVEVEETLLRSPDQKQRLVWLWYHTNHKIVSSPMQAKMNNLIGVVSGEPDIAVFVLSREIIRDQMRASGILEQFFKSYLSTSRDFSSLPSRVTGPAAIAHITNTNEPE